MSKAHIPPVVAVRGCNTFRENEKSELNNGHRINTIDALLFDENFHIHYIGKRKKNVQIKGLIRNT